MANQIKVADRALERFRKSKQPDHLDRAIQALETGDPPAAPAQRGELAQEWLRVFEVIDRESDPHFDPDDKPLLNLPLPPGVTGVSGMDPKSIADPAARAAYEKAIAANRAKAVKYNYQNRLRMAETRATEDFEGVLTRDYTLSNDDQAEIKSLIDSAAISSARKRALLQTAQQPR